MPAYHDFFNRRIHLLRDYRLYLPNPGFGNPVWENAAIRVLILRLSPFADVQRSTPHIFLFREARSAIPAAFIDMAFLPRATDAALFADSGLPLIIGTQSHRPLDDFDIVLISNSWLLEQVNLPFLLSHSNVPLWASARGKPWPPLFLGGSNATAAHALVSESGDCMADALYFGEGEGNVGRILRLCAESPGAPRRELLTRIAGEVSGVWVAGSAPVFVEKGRANAPAPDAPASALPAGAPVLPGPESATARLSITMGCPCLCSFCFEGHDRKPFREIPAENVLRSARELKIATGASTLEVESFNFNTHRGIADLMDGLARLYHRVNFMSQRIDVLARSPSLLDLEIAGDKNSFTLGIEGISERLRRFLHKSLTETDIRAVVEAIHLRKSREMKLFYMLTGRETEQDIEEFAGLVRWMKQVRERSTAPPRAVFSFGYMVRMPFTPLRHDPLVFSEAAFRKAGGRVKSICETNGFEFRSSSGWSEYAATQALASSEKSLHRLLARMADAGCITDSGLSQPARRVVQEWIDAHQGLSEEKPRGFPFPFEFLDDEGSRGFLHGQYERAKQGLDGGYESGTAGRPIGESGALASKARALDQLMEKKHRLRPVFVTARLPRETAGMGTPWIDAWLLKTFLAARPAEADNVLSVTVPFAAGTAMNADELPWFGRTVAAVIAWDSERFAASLGDEAGPLGALPRGLDPGAVTSTWVRVELSARFFVDPAQRLADFMRDAHAPVTISRNGDTATFTAAGKALKRKMLLAGTCRTTAEGAELVLTVGSRPFLREWLESFGDTGTARRALVEIL